MMFETVVGLMEASIFSDMVTIFAISNLTFLFLSFFKPGRGDPDCLFKAILLCPRFTWH